MKKRQEDGARRTRVRQGVFLALRRTIKRKTVSFRRRSTLFYAMTKHRIMLTFIHSPCAAGLRRFYARERSEPLPFLIFLVDLMDGQEKRMKKRQEGGARRTRVRQGVFLALRRTIKRKTVSFRRRSTLFYAMTKHRIMLTFIHSPCAAGLRRFYAHQWQMQRSVSLSKMCMRSVSNATLIVSPARALERAETRAMMFLPPVASSWPAKLR